MPRAEHQDLLDGHGMWRGIYCAIVDHPDFRILTPNERLVLFTLRVSPANNMAGIFLYYPQELEAQVGLDAQAVADALAGLEAKPSRKRPWIVRDDRVVWIRNALRHDPNVNLKNDNHVKSLLKIVAALPQSAEVVKKFRRYYSEISLRDHTKDHPRDPSKTIRKTIPKQGAVAVAVTGAVTGTGAVAVPLPDGLVDQGSDRTTDRPPEPSPPERPTTRAPADSNGHRDRRPAPGEYHALVARVKAVQPQLSDAEAEQRALVLFDAGIRSAAPAGAESGAPGR